MATATNSAPRKGTTNVSSDKFESDADKWKQRFNTCETNQRTLFKRVQKYYDIMYAVRSSDNIAPWRANVYIPILASKGWDLISRFSDVIPYFQVDVKNEIEIEETPQGQDDQLAYSKDALERGEKIQLKLQDDFENTGDEPMQLLTFDTLLDAVVAGTGFAKTPWIYEEKTTYARKVDATTGMIKDNAKRIQKKVKGGRNGFVPINFFNMFMPGKTSFFQQPYWIVREYTNIEDCVSTKRFSKSALNKLMIMNGAPTGFMQYNQARDRLTMGGGNQTFDDSVKNITLYECYEKATGDIITFGEGKSENGWVELERKSKKDGGGYWLDRPPLVPYRIRKKSFSPWGESLFENNAKLGAAINDLFNHYLDNWNMSIDQMLIYQDGTLVGDYIVKPGGEIVYTGSQAPQPFKLQDPNPNQLTSVLNVINQAIEAATVPQYLSGVPDSNLDKTGGTATGINQITEAATEKVGFMRNNIKWAHKIVGQNWLCNLQQFEDRPSEVKSIKQGVKRPVLIMPGDYQGEMDVTIDDDSMTPVSKQTRLQNFQGYLGTLQSLQQMGITQAQLFQSPTDIPRFNMSELIDEASQAHGFKDYTKFIQAADAETLQSGADGTDQAAEGASAGAEQMQTELQGA